MDVVMPQLGETVSEGKISTWFKKAGDTVEAGENIFEIETDKVSMEVQALASGVLTEIRVKDGETCPVGAIVAVIGAPGSKAAPETPAVAKAEAKTGAPDDEPGKVPSQAAPKVNGVAHRAAAFEVALFAETRTPDLLPPLDVPHGLKITPLARRLIAEHGLDIATVGGHARDAGARRIGRDEVLKSLEKGPATKPASAPAARAERPLGAERGETVAFNAMRRMTGKRLTESWQSIPHVFQATEVDFAAIDRVRSKEKEAFKARHGVSLTYLPFIARAVCLAIADFPRVNGRLEGDGLAVGRDVHLGIAVDLSHNGLVVPVVRHADELTLSGIAKAINRQVEKARSNKLTPDDFSGGTYTISNNGAFGTLFTAPIVNPPQVAILSTDAVKKKPVVVEGPEGDSIAIHPVGVVAQSFDHRAFDGAYSAAFLGRLKSILETRDWVAELS
jgi:2-oxoglutarate dehydrogenase E2 component (dihydrolipoamide succinyltransferase)